jgi:hypothetical protein
LAIDIPADIDAILGKTAFLMADYRIYDAAGRFSGIEIPGGTMLNGAGKTPFTNLR